MNSYLKSHFIFNFVLIFTGLLMPRSYAGETIFASQVRAFVNNSQTTVQAILDRVTPNSNSSSLKDLTASTSELNVLDGISANVTTANLNTLAGGSASNADALHIHTIALANATTLDDLDSVQFLRSDANDTFEGSTLNLGTDSNKTTVDIKGDISVSGIFYTPTLASLIAKVQHLDSALTALQAGAPLNMLLKEYQDALPHVTTVGENVLLNGEALIHLSPLFLEAVTIDENHPLFVRTTLLSADCNELAVVERTPLYFRVKELYQGDSNCPFLWEASAQRKIETIIHPKGDK